MIDRYGLTVSSTHSGLPGAGDVEKRLEDARIMGRKCVENLGPDGPRASGGPTTESIKRQTHSALRTDPDLVAMQLDMGWASKTYQGLRSVRQSVATHISSA